MILRDENKAPKAGAKVPHYEVLQVTLKEKLIGTGIGNLTKLEKVINSQAEKGYRLHTINTVNVENKGGGGGTALQATMIFEKID